MTKPFYLLILAFWLLGVTSLCQARGKPPEVRLALIAGNNIGQKGESPLRYAEDEAAKVARTLIQLGQLQLHHLTLLQGKKPKDLWRRLRILQSKSKRLSQQARVVIFFYYSGHGSKGFLHMGSHKASVNRIKRMLHQSGAQTVVAFFDSCHSGAIIRRKGFKRRPNFKIHLENKGSVQGRVYISSSGEFEASLESDDVQGSYFTHFLISGLRGQADRNKDGRVDVDELYKYAYQRTVMRTAMTRRGTQHPSFEFGLRGTGQLVLTWPQRSKSGLLFGPKLSGTYLILSRHQQELMAEVVMRKGERTFVALPPQSYIVRKRTGRGYYVAEVNLIWGGRKNFDVSKMVFRRYRPSLNKGEAFLGPPNNLTALFSLRTGIVAGNSFLLGANLSYKHRFTKSFSLGFGGNYHQGILQSHELAIPSQIAGVEILGLFQHSWGQLSLDFGGSLGFGLAWQHIRTDETRTSPVARVGVTSSLRWLIAQPWAIHLSLQSGAEFSKVNESIQTRPFFQVAIGPAFWW